MIGSQPHEEDPRSRLPSSPSTEEKLVFGKEVSRRRLELKASRVSKVNSVRSEELGKPVSKLIHPPISLLPGLPKFVAGPPPSQELSQTSKITIHLSKTEIIRQTSITSAFDSNQQRYREDSPADPGSYSQLHHNGGSRTFSGTGISDFRIDRSMPSLHAHRRS